MPIEAKRAMLDMDRLQEVFDAINKSIAQAGTIQEIQVNGVKVEITDKTINLTIPTAVSDLEGSSDLATKSDVAAAVASSDHLSRKKVASVADIDPEAEDADKFIYLVPKEEPVDGDEYDEYMIIDGKVDKVGDWAINLDGYVEKEEGKGLSTNDFTDADKTKLEGIAAEATKVEATEGSGTLTIDGNDVELFRMATDDEFQAMMTLLGFTD